MLTEELPKLEKLVKRGKKLTDEIIEDRLAKVCCSGMHAGGKTLLCSGQRSSMPGAVQVKHLRDTIESVPDGVHNARKHFKVSPALQLYCRQGKMGQASWHLTCTRASSVRAQCVSCSPWLLWTARGRGSRPSTSISLRLTHAWPMILSTTRTPMQHGNLSRRVAPPLAAQTAPWCDAHACHGSLH